MKKLITDLLDSSYKGNMYHKAMDCFVALRNGCVQQEVGVLVMSFPSAAAFPCLVV